MGKRESRVADGTARTPASQYSRFVSIVVGRQPCEGDAATDACGRDARLLLELARRCGIDPLRQFTPLVLSILSEPQQDGK